MGQYVNNQRNERTGHEKGGSFGEQGAHGTGKVKCSAEGGSSPDPKFKTAADFLGAPIFGELEVPGVSIVKGASSPSFEGPRKGKPGNPMGGGSGLRKPKDAEDAGR